MSVTTDTMNIDRLTELVLDLSVEERALLLDRLHDSMLSPREREIQDAWLKVAAKRLEEVRSGAVQTIDGPTALRELRERVRR